MELLFIEITEMQEVSKNGERSLFAEDSKTRPVTKKKDFHSMEMLMQNIISSGLMAYISLVSHKLRFWISQGVSGQSHPPSFTITIMLGCTLFSLFRIIICVHGLLLQETEVMRNSLSVDGKRATYQAFSMGKMCAHGQLS